MTNIIERLRDTAQGEAMFGFDGMRDDPDPLLMEAADEIERQRNNVNILIQQTQDQQAEIERLRALADESASPQVEHIRQIGALVNPAPGYCKQYTTEEPLPAKQQGEPVAWIEGPHGVIRANPAVRFSGPTTLNWSIPLYAAPQQRQPLTPTQALTLFNSHYKTTETWADQLVAFARAVEAAHGITGGTT